MVKGENQMKTKLHEAMETVIKKLGNTKPKQLAWIINNSKLYEKRDLSEVEVSQIYARVGKYPHLFYINENKEVCLKGA